jgi:superfamily I DNA and RNA helicase
LCAKLTKQSRIIWGYDECQNILNMQIQDTVQTFGVDATGVPIVDFSKDDKIGQDIVLPVCYRTPRNVLATAFALGLGIYGEHIIQLPENKEHWEDWGFQIISGQYIEGSVVKIARSLEGSLVERDNLLQGREDMIVCESFGELEAESDFVVERILNDIKEELRPEDICVICLDDTGTRKYFNRISDRLLQRGVNVFDLGNAPSSNTLFSMPDHVTLSTIYRAKGNEKGSVYIVGVNKIFDNENSIISRNKLFTAITRSKAWVTITGVGAEGARCKREIEQVKLNNFELSFTMPNMRDLKVFQRDLAKTQEAANVILAKIRSLSRTLGIDENAILTDLYKKRLER